MKGSELIKKALEPDMPDKEAVRQECIKELHKGKGKPEKTNKKKPNRKIQKSIYAGLGACAALWLCVINLPAKTGAESWIARLQTWLHLNNERVEVGEMEKSSIRIPKDCEEVEYGDERYLAKSYASIEELEKDIGKHLEIWRGVDRFEESDIALNIWEDYAEITLKYSISNVQAKDTEYTNVGKQIRDLRCYITIPLSEDFSMNNIKLKDQVLKDAKLDAQGHFLGYGQNAEYSIIETYHSDHLDVDISVIKQKKVENVAKEKDTNTSYYYLYFVYKGLSYQIGCYSNLDAAKSVVEKLE